MVTRADRYSSFKELEKSEFEGKAFRRYALDRGSPATIIAIHGGNIEPGTSEIAAAISGEELSLYCFEGIKPKGNQTLHIASHRFDEPSCLELIERSRIVVSIHGCSNSDEKVLIGGLDVDLRAKVIRGLRKVGIVAEIDKSNHSGKDINNVCNRGMNGRGVQLEISKGLRLEMFEGLKSDERKRVKGVFGGFICSIKDAISEFR